MYNIIKNKIENSNNIIRLGCTRSKSYPTTLRYFVEVINNKTKETQKHFVSLEEYKTLEAHYLAALVVHKKVRDKQKRINAKNALTKKMFNKKQVMVVDENEV